MCTRPCPEKWVHGSFLCSERWVYRSFLCSRLWSLPSCTQRALILQHYMRQSSLGPGHIAGILGSMMGAGGLVHQLTQVHSTLGTSDCLYRRKLHPISREKKKLIPGQFCHFYCLTISVGYYESPATIAPSHEKLPSCKESKNH